MKYSEIVAEDNRLLDQPTATPAELAKKHGVSVEHITQQLAQGIQTESEHTSNKDVAREIALDHIAEDPNYYAKLSKADLEESADPKSMVTEFAVWVAKRIGLSKLPEFEFSSTKPTDDFHNTGMYDPATNTLWVYTHKRNTIDIMRTVAHELVHRKQDEEGRIESTYPGHPLEQESDAAAGYLVKIYGKKHPEILQ